MRTQETLAKGPQNGGETTNAIARIGGDCQGLVHFAFFFGGRRACPFLDPLFSPRRVAGGQLLRRSAEWPKIVAEIARRLC
jgi:hypothetical protein